MPCKGIAKKGKRKIQAHPTVAATVHALTWQFARRLGGMQNQKQVLPILHFARLAVILDKSRGVSDMRNQKQVIDFAFRSTCSNFAHTKIINYRDTCIFR